MKYVSTQWWISGETVSSSVYPLKFGSVGFAFSQASANISLLPVEDAKAPAAKLLKKLRPDVLKEDTPLPPPIESIKSPPSEDSKEGLPSASVKGEGIPNTPNTVAAAG